MSNFVPPRYRLIHRALISQEEEQETPAPTPICEIGRILNPEQEYWVYADHPKPEITCPECRRELGIPPMLPTLVGIMLDNVAVRMNMVRTQQDVNFWEEYKGLTLGIDPDGEAAKQWVELSESFDEHMRPFMEMMKEHVRQSEEWPEEIIDKEIE